MNRNSANRLAIVVVLLSLPVVLHAQELSADVVMRRADRREERSKLYKGKAAVRLESGEEGYGGVKGTVVIYDLTRRVAYFLNPTVKSYVSRTGYGAGGPVVGLFVPQKDNPCALLPVVSKDSACQKIRAESVNGRNTEKWQATQTRGGKTITEYVWVDSELHIAIKWQTTDQDTGQLENIRLGSQPESLFALPSDYREMLMPARAPSNH